MTTSMQPVRPVVPVLRSPGPTSRDHEARPDGHTAAGRPVCGARINHSTWLVIAAWQTRNPCHVCAAETA